MAIRFVADPDVAPGRWNHKLLDARQGIGVSYLLAAIEVFEAIFAALTEDARRAVANIYQVDNSRCALIILVDFEELLVREINFDGLCFHSESWLRVDICCLFTKGNHYQRIMARKRQLAPFRGIRRRFYDPPL